MPADRYYLDTSFLLHQTVQLEGLERHHLVTVMRTRIGEQVELVNGQGQKAVATLIAMDKRTATLKIDQVETQPPSTFSVIVCQALPRLNRLEWIVEKGTELGMTELWLFPGALSEKTSLTETQMHRLEQIAIGAMKQCGRLDLPPIVLKAPLEKWEWDRLPFPAFFGDTSESPPFIKTWKPEQGLLFFVGPETGFSSKETALLRAKGVQGVKLHPHILRTETASLVVLSLVHQFLN